MTENHPVYAVWRRKMSMNYVIAHGGDRLWTIISWRGLGSVSGLVGTSRADHIVVSLPRSWSRDGYHLDVRAKRNEEIS